MFAICAKAHFHAQSAFHAHMLLRRKELTMYKMHIHDMYTKTEPETLVRRSDKEICNHANNLLELQRIQYEAQIKAQQGRNINKTPLHEIFKRK